MGNIREWWSEKLVLVTLISLSYTESVYSCFQRENREEGLSAPAHGQGRSSAFSASASTRRDVPGKHE